MRTTDAAPRVLEILGRGGRGLRVTFTWDEDRFGHEIAYLEGPAATVCLKAELGVEQDPWPASPALQQLSLEGLQSDRPRALLVGMAGKSHWSQSVEADATAASLTFDVACRVQRQPRWLGSSYRTLHDAWRSPTADGRIAMGSQIELNIEPAAGSPPSRIERVGDLLVIAPDLRTLRLPTTVRWKYRVTVV